MNWSYINRMSWDVIHVYKVFFSYSQVFIKNKPYDWGYIQVSKWWMSNSWAFFSGANQILLLLSLFIWPPGGQESHQCYALFCSLKSTWRKNVPSWAVKVFFWPFLFFMSHEWPLMLQHSNAKVLFGSFYFIRFPEDSRWRYVPHLKTLFSASFYFPIWIKNVLLRHSWSCRMNVSTKLKIYLQVGMSAVSKYFLQFSEPGAFNINIKQSISKQGVWFLHQFIYASITYLWFFNITLCLLEIHKVARNLQNSLSITYSANVSIYF